MQTSHCTQNETQLSWAKLRNRFKYLKANGKLFPVDQYCSTVVHIPKATRGDDALRACETGMFHAKRS